MSTKRLSYKEVQITTTGGIIKCAPSTDGWKVMFETSAEQPRVAYAKTIEEAGQQLVNNLKRLALNVEEDLKAFVERNR